MWRDHFTTVLFSCLQRLLFSFLLGLDTEFSLSLTRIISRILASSSIHVVVEFQRSSSWWRNSTVCVCRRVWISDKAVKQLPMTAAAGYLGAFSLRQRMLFCVQNLEYYMMEEAIEPNWIRFMSRLPNVSAFIHLSFTRYFEWQFKCFRTLCCVVFIQDFSDMVSDS